MSNRLHVTQAAAALLRRLRQQHGPLLLHLSGGCCEGSAPICLRQSGFRSGAGAVLLGEAEGCPFDVGAAQAPYGAGFALTLDVLPEGGGDRFSLEATDGARFVVRSRPLAVAPPQPSVMPAEKDRQRIRRFETLM